ncbi:hypothetical protein Pyn_02091 [Prunus yedoensis var. nudiflora]|uniref:Uncharacterized protein n=1 Tax=Prunus yedoensis var. nudiflora TaxID=2094558 RepID=A0A315B1A5_PRUYE|nr:hypothetical protein Pyn_02091 [Prunus yedoensis var. nudiflora]
MSTSDQSPNLFFDIDELFGVVKEAKIAGTAQEPLSTSDQDTNLFFDIDELFREVEDAKIPRSQQEPLSTSGLSVVDNGEVGRTTGPNPLWIRLTIHIYTHQ